MNTPDDKEKTQAALWRELMVEAQECRRIWGLGFPVISTHLLRKYWQKATGYLPPEK